MSTELINDLISKIEQLNLKVSHSVTYTNGYYLAKNQIMSLLREERNEIENEYIIDSLYNILRTRWCNMPLEKYNNYLIASVYKTNFAEIKSIVNDISGVVIDSVMKIPDADYSLYKLIVLK